MTSVLASPAGQLALTRPVRWRYHFTDFRLGRFLTTLPLRGVSLSDVLSGAADGTAEVPLTSSAVRDRDPFVATVPRRSCMWAERQELDPGTGRVAATDIPWAGVVMGRDRALGSRTMKLKLVTWPSYFQRRLVPGLIFRQIDKFVIMRTLVSYGVDQPLVDTPEPGVYQNSPHLEPMEYYLGHPDYPGELSGVLADRTYLASDLKPALEAMTELGESGTGFDWRMVPYMESALGDLNALRVRLDLGYPRLGRTAPADLRWSTDAADRRQRWGHVADLSITEDGSAVNNRVTAVGSGTGSDQIRETVEDSAEMLGGYPLYEASLSSSTQEDRTVDTVRGKAQGALAAGLASQVRLSGVKVRGDLPPALSSYAVGDDGTFKVGDTTTGVTETFVGQIIGRTIQPAEPGGTEQVTIDVQGTRAA